MDYKLIGQNIKSIRRSKKITQQALADQIGRAKSTIQQYEKGSIEIPVSVLEKIAIALDITFEELTGAYSFEVSGKQRPNLFPEGAFSLNKKIKSWRQAKGLTVNELSKLLDVSIDDITAWENGKKSINLEYYKKLSVALGIPEIYLFVNPDHTSLNPDIPGTAKLSANTFPDNVFMPQYYRCYFDEEAEIHYIEFPYFLQKYSHPLFF